MDAVQGREGERASAGRELGEGLAAGPGFKRFPLLRRNLDSGIKNQDSPREFRLHGFQGVNRPYPDQGIPVRLATPGEPLRLDPVVDLPELERLAAIRASRPDQSQGADHALGVDVVLDRVRQLVFLPFVFQSGHFDPFLCLPPARDIHPEFSTSSREELSPSSFITPLGKSLGDSNGPEFPPVYPEFDPEFELQRFQNGD